MINIRDRICTNQHVSDGQKLIQQESTQYTWISIRGPDSRVRRDRRGNFIHVYQVESNRYNEKRGAIVNVGIQHEATHVSTYKFILKFIHVYQVESNRYNEKRKTIVNVGILHEATHVSTNYFILKFVHVYHVESNRYNEKRRVLGLSLSSLGLP